MKQLNLSPTPAERLLHPLQEFLDEEASSGILLLLGTIIALVWANSPWVNGYHNLWHDKLTIGYGNLVLSKSLLLWINDGLMAIFFLVVGLEIKREVMTGELSSPKQALLPIVAAIGGMVCPALIYVFLNLGGPGSAGWGIPMATDIAFALGVLALLGKRVPVALKVFLTAFAIVDDIGAVLVIALFYSGEPVWSSLIVAAGFLLFLLLVNRLGVHHPLVYLLLGVGLWLAFLKSGIHATIAGVLLAMTVPGKARIDQQAFVRHSRDILDNFETASTGPSEVKEKQQAALQALEAAIKHAESPLQRMEHRLHPWVAFLIMPIFALANAGITFSSDFPAIVTQPVSIGVILGLVLGKQIGITTFVWLAVKSRLADLPRDVTWRQIYGVSWLGGIGFTMSIFIASLAFGDTPLLTAAKAGILAASLLAGTVGWLILRNISPLQPEESASDH